MVASLKNGNRGIYINRGKPVLYLRFQNGDYLEVLKKELLQVLPVIDIDPGTMGQQPQVTALLNECSSVQEE
jgi:hypothetical protein